MGSAVSLLFSSSVNQFALDNFIDILLVFSKHLIPFGSIILEFINPKLSPSVGMLILPVLQEVYGQKIIYVKTIAALALFVLISCEAVYGNNIMTLFICFAVPITLLSIYTEEIRTAEKKPYSFKKIVKEFLAQAFAEGVIGALAVFLLEKSITEETLPFANRIAAMMFLSLAAATTTIATLIFRPLVLSRFAVGNNIGAHLSESLSNGMVSWNEKLTLIVGGLQIVMATFNYSDGHIEWDEKIEEEEKQRKTNR